VVSGIAEVTATGGVVAVSVCDGDEAADAAEGGISSVMMCDGKGNTATVPRESVIVQWIRSTMLIVDVRVQRSTQRGTAATRTNQVSTL
jgi:hypothetical protein